MNKSHEKTNMNKPVVGFIGLGLMGSNMAECLLNNGFKLNVMGRNKDAVAAATTLGAVEVSTPKQLAEASDIIMLCVTTSDVVESLILSLIHISEPTRPY